MREREAPANSTISQEQRIRAEGRAELLEEGLALGANLLALGEDDWCWELPARRATLVRYLEVQDEVRELAALDTVTQLRATLTAQERQVQAWARQRWAELPPGSPAPPTSTRALLEGLATHAPLEQGREVARSDGPGTLVLLAVAVLTIAGLTQEALLGASALGLLAVGAFLRPRQVARWWLLEHALVLESGGSSQTIDLADVERVAPHGADVAFWGDDPRRPLARVRSPRWKGLLGLVSVLHSRLRPPARQLFEGEGVVIHGERPDPAGGAPQVGLLVADGPRALWIPEGVVTVAALDALELSEPRPRLAEGLRELLVRGEVLRNTVLTRLEALPGTEVVALAHAHLVREASGWRLDRGTLQLRLELDLAEARLLRAVCASPRAAGVGEHAR